jgi:hypothetical protein
VILVSKIGYVDVWIYNELEAMNEVCSFRYVDVVYGYVMNYIVYGYVMMLCMYLNVVLNF